MMCSPEGLDEDTKKQHQTVTCQIYGHVVKHCAECNVGAEADEDVNETNKVLADNFIKMTCKSDGSKNSLLYYEAHVTIEPIFGERREEASLLAKECNFKIASLLMKKREEDTVERSQYDTFMTGHAKNYGDLRDRLIELVGLLQKNGFKVWRYKIEDTICDSRTEDVFNLIK